ncbi:hypothetical protein HYH03_017577 [Edaphochlamys debaryana]|uniref:Ankyrin repeat domain-containing protein n=1 Tax=Edaphochlamys debaryana TaxID=47281 RepID=A0A835XHP5_9CHLO|nr:hypothetical protein HYH03_017577 [Edaphochlamys debaryana]|eukprot:KAG2483570.1 hypothetical protein HYH03_017577 [Edaphochlamys debaryana]
MFAAHWSAPADACRDLSRAKRLRLLCLTAATGELANLEVAVAAAGLVLTADVMTAAAAAGEVEACSWLLELERGLRSRAWELDSALSAAARANQRAACEWLLAHVAVLPSPPSWRDDAATSAARGGHLDMVEWLLDQGAAPKEHTYGVVLVAAAKGERLELLERLLSKLPEGAVWEAILAAAEAGLRELMHRLYEQLPEDHVPPPDDLARLPCAVAKGCDLVTLQHWWPRLRGSIGEDAEAKAAVIQAAAAGPTPDWQAKVTGLRQALGYSPQAGCLAFAVESGNEEAVRFLLSQELQGTPGGKYDSTMVWPALYQGIDVRLDRMYEGPPPHTLALLRLVTEAGWLPELYWLERLFESALYGGHVEAANWLYEELLAQDPDFGLSTRHFAWGARSGSVLMLAWLQAQGCPLGPEVWDMQADNKVYVAGDDMYPPQVGAVDSGCEAALEWLAEAGCEMPTDGTPYVTAAYNGDLRTLAVLRRLGMPLGPADGETFEAATKWGAPLPALKQLAGMLAEEAISISWANAKTIVEGVRDYNRWAIWSGEPREERGELEDFRLKGEGVYEEQLAWIEEQRAAAGEEEPQGEEVEVEEGGEGEEGGGGGARGGRGGRGRGGGRRACRGRRRGGAAEEDE